MHRFEGTFGLILFLLLAVYRMGRRQRECWWEYCRREDIHIWPASGVVHNASYTVPRAAASATTGPWHAEYYLGARNAPTRSESCRRTCHILSSDRRLVDS